MKTGHYSCVVIALAHHLSTFPTRFMAGISRLILATTLVQPTRVVITGIRRSVTRFTLICIMIQIMRQNQCQVEPCDRDVFRRGLCGKHYHRLLRYGDPLAGHWEQGATTEERFLAKVQYQPSGCWLWTGGADKDGYGTFWNGENRDGDNKRPVMVLAHRWAYEYFIGPVPWDLNVLHHCDNPPCVNFMHLFVGTQRDNVRDCIEKGRRAA